MNKEIIPGDKNSYVTDEYEVIAEQLSQVYGIQDILRTLKAKTLERLMSADQSGNGYDLRLAYKSEHIFYTKIESAVKKINKRKDK